ANLFRKLFRKSVKSPGVWYHQIPLKQLVSFYLRDELALEMQVLLYEANRFLADNSHKLQKLTNKPDETILNLDIDQAAPVILSNSLSQACSALIEEVEIFEKSIALRASEIFDQVFSRFQNAYHKVGTMELKSNKFSSRNIVKKHTLLNGNYATLSQRWSNTH